VFLDRDDIGINNTVVTQAGPEFKEHQETIAIRAVVPGIYVVTVHVYRANSTHFGVDSGPALPYPVKVTLTKLNPVIEDVVVKSVTVNEIGEQKTVFCFTVGDKGQVFVDHDCDVPFVPLKKASELLPPSTSALIPDIER
jgi:hypothetical protein